MKLFNLSSPSITFSNKLITILIGYIIMLIWMIGISHFLNWLYPSPAISTSVPIDDNDVPPLKFTLFITLLWAPFWEEMVHRHAFGLVVKRIGNNFLLPAMIISSFLFATGHNDTTQMNVLRQGIGGMIFFYVYVKNGYSVLSSIILHSMWNATVFLSPTWIW